MAMNDIEIIACLKKIVDSMGVDAFANHARANALISDFFPGNDNAKTRKLLKSIIEVDAVSKISSASSGDFDGVCKAVKTLLMDDELLSEDRAESAVGLVCGALGKRKPNFPKPVPPKPQSTPAPDPTPAQYSGSSASYNSTTSYCGGYSSAGQSAKPTSAANTAPSNNTYGLNLNYHVKHKKKVPKKFIGWTVAICALVAFVYFIVWPKMIYPNKDAESLYTPEIVQSYCTDSNEILTITECTQDGHITATLEINSDKGYYNVILKGVIESKKNNGEIRIGWESNEVVNVPNGEYWLDSLTATITDNYQTLKTNVGYSYTTFTAGVNDAYTIKTAEDFQKLSGSNATYYLKNDIDLGGVEWTPIEGFSGMLIGNGFTIENFKINSMQSNVGLFATIEGSVSNLTIKNATVTTTGRTERIGILCGTLKGRVSEIYIVASEINAPNSNYVGSVAGYVSKLPKNATVTEITTDTKVIGREYVGGVFGSVTPECHGEGDSATFTNISNKGAVTGENYVGGLFGNMYFNGSHAIVHYDFPAYLISVSNAGNVTGKTYVGGIVGSGDTDTNDSYIQSSSNESGIVGNAMVGCIAGFCDLTVDNCTNEGSTLTADGFIMVDGAKIACVGGYVGKGAVINNCTNTVDVAYTGGGKYVAGIMGYSLCYPKNAMLNTLCNKANISGADYVGGIFGRVSPESNGDGDSLAFNNMKNEGTIKGNDYVGGILGYLYLNGSHAIVHYNFPAYLTSMENVGAVSGNCYVGGIMGYGRTDTEVSEIISSISTGTVKGKSNTGNLIGKVENITVK